jgi:predicted nucleotidyltransferase component of viral defense system
MTPFQARVLETLFIAGVGQNGYCFTGGTALAEFYLQHRHSEDLDAEQSAEELKVEFARYAGAQMSPALAVGRVVVDSFEDIAVNKVCAIYGRTEIKDFVDLFFILKESKFTLDYLVGRAKEKEGAFDWEDAVLEFATKLLEVRNLQLHQIRMIKPLLLDDLRSYLVPKAEEIIRRLRPLGTR